MITVPVWAQPLAVEPRCTVQITDVYTARSAENGQRPPLSGQWKTVTLPHEWSWRLTDPVDDVWYRIEWRQDCVAGVQESVALLLRSIVMAGEVYINDHFLWRDKQLVEPLSRSFNMPRYWLLPDTWIKEGTNTVWIRAVGIKHQSVGIGDVQLGPAAQLHQQYDNMWWRNRTLYSANMIVSVVIGTLFFCIWFLRRDQTAYGWYTFSSLFWIVFISNTLLTTPWPWSDTMTAAKVNIIALMLSIACFCIFTLRFSQQFRKRYERVLWITTGFFIVALIVTPQAYIGYIQISSILVTTAFFLLNCITFPLYALRSRQREHLLLAGCLVVLFLTSLHDVLHIFKIIPTQFSIFPYSNIAITLSLSGILGLRHAQNVRRIEQFNLELEQSIANARAELATTLEREYALTLTNTRLRDRLDIAHDLHDGLGGSIVHLMASVEKGFGPVNRPQVISMLKLIRDDLRLAIDSNSSPSIKVPATPASWIAPLRHRFTALFDELNIRSEWVFPGQWQRPPDALQCLALTRIVEEAMTNIIKHSHANNVRITLSQEKSDILVLEIEDNGLGFDVAAVQQANLSIGMRSMATRIARVGGKIDLSSARGRTLLKTELVISE